MTKAGCVYVTSYVLEDGTTVHIYPDGVRLVAPGQDTLEGMRLSLKASGQLLYALTGHCIPDVISKEIITKQNKPEEVPTLDKALEIPDMATTKKFGDVSVSATKQDMGLIVFSNASGRFPFSPSTLVEALQFLVDAEVIPSIISTKLRMKNMEKDVREKKGNDYLIRNFEINIIEDEGTPKRLCLSLKGAIPFSELRDIHDIIHWHFPEFLVVFE